MFSSLNKKDIFHTLLLLVVIILHAILRITELPYSRPLIGEYFFIPSINLAAGKGFHDEGFLEDVILEKESPELSNFLHSFYSSPEKKLSPFNTLHTFQDYKKNIHITGTKLPDSVGYRYLLGLIWKYFGFNWYFVGLFNYFLSLLALLSLLYCSYKILGISYSVIIGLIFDISLPEIFYTVHFGRDGIPLWFASYLICVLVIFFSKYLTLKRIITFTILIGLIIYGAMQGRTSTIYFLPLVISIYFVLFFFYQNEKNNFNSIKFTNNPLGQRTSLFCLATTLTLTFALVPQEITEALLSSPNCYKGGFAHCIFLGLGMWGEIYLPFHPSQVRYSDVMVYYDVLEYGQRVLNYTPHTLLYLSQTYNDVVLKLYLSILKTYPYFFFRHALWESFSNALFFLGIKGSVLNDILLLSPPNKVFFTYTKLIFGNWFFFVFSLVGSLLLYFKMKLKKTAIILVFFILYNSGVAFLQFYPRHLLMGHPAYYFLSGVTLAFIFENYIKTIFINPKKLLNFSLKKALLKSKLLSKHPFLNYFEPLFNRNSFIRLFPIFILVTACSFFFILLKGWLKNIEINNIHKFQLTVDSLPKHPLGFNPSQKKLEIPPSLISKTIGIYCEMGRVSLPKKVNINLKTDIHIDFKGSSSPFLYHTEIFPIIGEDVMLFIPLYIINSKASVEIDHNNQCKSFKWADLKDWEGYLWEGSYDRSMVSKF